MHLNKVNGKAYIGYTKYSVQKRFGCHVSYAIRGSQFLFHKAIRKYGLTAWETCVLRTCGTVEEARLLERRYIAFFGTLTTGYNMTEGGEGNSNAGKTLSPEHRAKVVAILLANKPTKEQMVARNKNKIGKPHSAQGIKNIVEGIKKARPEGPTELQRETSRRIGKSNKGKLRSEETKARIADALKGKTKSPEHRARLSEAARRRGEPA